MTDTSLEISILLWNVWNLPSWLTDGRSKSRAAQISPLLNAYDVVVLNEAFVNHRTLLSMTTHPYRYIPKTPWWRTIFSSGLIFLSRFEIVDADFEMYRARSGVDRFAAKGIGQIRVQARKGDRDLGTVSIFGTHSQASHNNAAQVARMKQVRQAAQFIHKHQGSFTEPTDESRSILLGDLNMGPFLGDDRNFSQHYFDAQDHVSRTCAYGELLLNSGLSEITEYVHRFRDEDEYSREICRVLGSPAALQHHAFSYELQEYTDGANRLSDTKALCIRLFL